jgi:hypothetical protein
MDMSYDVTHAIVVMSYMDMSSDVAHDNVVIWCIDTWCDIAHAIVFVIYRYIISCNTCYFGDVIYLSFTWSRYVIVVRFYMDMSSNVNMASPQ